jgi:hypothetical protein
MNGFLISSCPPRHTGLVGFYDAAGLELASVSGFRVFRSSFRVSSFVLRVFLQFVSDFGLRISDLTHHD